MKILNQSLMMLALLAGLVGCGARGDDCGAVGDTCQQSSDCCDSGAICRDSDNTCQLAQGSRCGDGTCDPGETPQNCCADCECAQGAVCQNNVCQSPTPVTSVLNLTVVDNCLDGESITLRLFDETNDTASELASISPGSAGTVQITCTSGDSICLGGRQLDHNLSFGVDLDNSRTCQDCCFTCAGQSVSLSPLTC